MRSISLALILLGLPAAAQSTWYVDVNGVPPGTGTALDPYTSIDFAVSQPSTLAGDLILVLPGTYLETVLVDKGVTLMSTNGNSSTVIDAAGAGSALRLAFTGGSDVRIDGFTLRGGAGTLGEGGLLLGGGIYAKNVTGKVSRCTIEQNDADVGGGVYMLDSFIEFARCRIQDNLVLPTTFVPQGGGLYSAGGAATLRRSAILRNIAGDPITPGEGGGIYAGGNVDVAGCRIRDNVAERGGGGVFGGAVIHRSAISGNLGQFGGGIRGPANVTNTLLEDNLADSSSGTANFGGAASGGTVLTGCTLRNNLAYGSGGAVSTATLIDCKVKDNTGSPGFGSFGIVNGGAELATLIDCEVSGNQALGGFGYSAFGGGAGNSTLVDCDVFGNSTTTLGGFSSEGGGGVWGSTVTGCRIFDNDTGGLGGGSYESNLDFCEVFGNTAQFGGAAADGQFARCTVYGNLAVLGGGVFSEFFVDVQDSILWNNGAEIFAGGGAVTVGYSDVQGGWPGTGNIDDDPLFWDAAGGDFNLMSGSPCIDAGNPASALDPDGSRADMGANPYDPSYMGD